MTREIFDYELYGANFLISNEFSLMNVTNICISHKFIFANTVNTLLNLFGNHAFNPGMGKCKIINYSESKDENKP